MGNFSWKCRGCGCAINSDYDHGHECALLFFNKGELVEYMTGQYDGYGRVYDPRTGKSIEWENNWDLMVDAMYGEDTSSGMVAYHRRCAPANLLRAKPGRSKDDRNQGWGKFAEVEHDLYYITHVVTKLALTAEMRATEEKASAWAAFNKAVDDMRNPLNRLRACVPQLPAKLVIVRDETTGAWSVEWPREESKEDEQGGETSE